MTPKEKITKARSLLIMDHPFFGCLSMQLTIIEDSGIQTAATDGKSLFYCPAFIDTLTQEQITGLLAHEVLHCALGHIWRGEGKEHEAWNIAADYAINENLTKTGFSLPPGALLDRQYYNLASEEVYNRLPKGGQSKGGTNPGKGTPSKNGSDPGKCGSVICPDKGETDKKQEIQAIWKQAVQQAMEVTKDMGTLPAELINKLQEVMDPPLPWYVLLRDFVERSARNDYSWSRPSPRYFSQGVILPSLISEELSEVVIAIDTSGSTQAILGRFANEVSGVLQAYKTKIKVIYCDSVIHKVEEYSTEDLPIQLNPIGGGGTDFRPVFDYIAKEGDSPACLLFLTDLYGPFPTQGPDYPVMWITPTQKVEAPFGTTVRFN
jgi:predicted metal-dependent peptidase